MLENPAGTMQEFWTSTGFSFKLYLFISALVMVPSLFVEQIWKKMVDIPQLAIWQVQLWRPFTALLASNSDPMAIINLGLAFLWLRKFLQDKETSTVYRVIEVAILGLEVQLVFLGVGFLFSLFLDTSEYKVFYSYGWFPVILVYEFRNSLTEPEEKRRFFCLPFLIKNRHFPWVVLPLVALLSQQLVCFLAVGLVGVLQELIYRQMLVKLPFSFYLFLEKCLPNFIRSRPDFVSVQTVQEELRAKCCGGRRSLEEGMSVVAAASSFTPIGGELPRGANYRTVWSKHSNTTTDNDHLGTHSQDQPQGEGEGEDQHQGEEPLGLREESTGKESLLSGKPSPSIFD